MITPKPSTFADEFPDFAPPEPATGSVLALVAAAVSGAVMGSLITWLATREWGVFW